MSLIATIATAHTPETLGRLLQREPGRVLLRTRCFDLPHARYSIVAARPFLTLRAAGSRCELSRPDGGTTVQYGNPWRLMDMLMARYELLDEIDLPFPLGGAFGFWGYDLRYFVEPRLRMRAPRDLEVPDCWVGFYDSVVVFDHRAELTYLIATGLQPDGSRDRHKAKLSLDAWRSRLESEPAEDVTSGRSPAPPSPGGTVIGATHAPGAPGAPDSVDATGAAVDSGAESNLDRDAFCECVRRALRYIRAGDIYQVNLSQRWHARGVGDGWDHWLALSSESPAPFAAFLDAGDFQIASVSPESFLSVSGNHIVTRPIKGTRPRSGNPDTDARLAYELQTSSKELAELVMITDLLRNDLGRICEYGSVNVPDLMRLERFAHVQHLVSTVEGALRPGVTHLAAMEACFPGGSITGAPKIRAMEIIDELEPVSRGAYTGCCGYLGFNKESQLNILIRSSVVMADQAWYHAGAGIVADSDPAAEYDETVAKAAGFLAAIAAQRTSTRLLSRRVRR